MVVVDVVVPLVDRSLYPRKPNELSVMVCNEQQRHKGGGECGEGETVQGLLIRVGEVTNPHLFRGYDGIKGHRGAQG